MALDDGIHLLHRRKEAGEIDLPMVLERDLSENRQRLAQLCNVDQRRITENIALCL